MKHAHRKAIIAALAGAGLLAGNMAFGATIYTDHMEREAMGKRQKTHMTQKTSTKTQRQGSKQRNQ